MVPSIYQTQTLIIIICIDQWEANMDVDMYTAADVWIDTTEYMHPYLV